LERQRRSRKSREQTIEQAAALGLTDAFIGRELRGIEAAAIPATVCDRFGAIEELRDRVAVGELEARSAEKLAGFLAVGPDLIPARTRRRREARLRQLGIALDPLAEARRRVDVAAALRVFIDSFSEAVAA
jgi:hypothetical protein